MLVLVNCKKQDNFLLLLVWFSPFQNPDTLENCDLSYGALFPLAVATEEVKTVKGQWLTSPVKNTSQSNKLGIIPVNQRQRGGNFVFLNGIQSRLVLVLQQVRQQTRAWSILNCKLKSKFACNKPLARVSSTHSHTHVRTHTQTHANTHTHRNRLLSSQKLLPLRFIMQAGLC